MSGRGLAAALLLGTQGVNAGTRFVASEEAAVDGDWKRRIVVADSEDAVKVEFANEIFPSEGPGGYGTLQRVLRTPFVAAWNRGHDKVGREAGRLREELMTSIEEGRAHELVPLPDRARV